MRKDGHASGLMLDTEAMVGMYLWKILSEIFSYRGSSPALEQPRWRCSALSPQLSQGLSLRVDICSLVEQRADCRFSKASGRRVRGRTATLGAHRDPLDEHIGLLGV